MDKIKQAEENYQSSKGGFDYLATESTSDDPAIVMEDACTQADFKLTVLTVVTVLLMMIVTTLCTKVLKVTLTGIGRSLKKKMNWMLLGQN